MFANVSPSGPDALKLEPKFKFTEIWPESHVTQASAEVKFRRSGHGSQAMLTRNNSKWYSSTSIVKLSMRIQMP